MHRKVLLENISALYVLQALNFVLPLVTFPYLVRVLGTERFGLVAFAMSLAQYFVVITDYGFNLTGTRLVSINRNDNYMIRKIFYSIMYVKLFLLILCLAILTLLMGTISLFSQNCSLYFFSFLAVVGSFISPVWFYQGVERIRLIAILNIIFRIIATVAIFVFINNEADYILTVIIQTMGVVLSGLISTGIIIRQYRMYFIIPEFQYIKNIIMDGWTVFLSQVSVNLFSNSGIFILGIYTDAKTVGSYAIAEKIIKAAINMVAPICNSIFPRVGVLFKESWASAISFLARITKWGIDRKSVV